MCAGAAAEPRAEPGWEALAPGQDGVTEPCSGAKTATGFVSQIREAPLPCVIAICTTALLCVALFFGAGPIEQLLLQITELPVDLPANAAAGIAGELPTVLPGELPAELPGELPAGLPADPSAGLPGAPAEDGGLDAE